MSSPLTPSFLMDLEHEMRVISNNEYQRLLTNLWWKRVAKVLPSGAKADRINWLLDTATIQYVNRLGAEVEFDDILANTTEYVNKAATNGLKLNRFQLEDHLNGVAGKEGMDLAGQWSRTIGNQAAYWPQKQIAVALRNGGVASQTSYDGQVFFSGSHPLNPFDSSLGTYANDFTGGSAGVYPGAAPIDSSVTVDVALNNINAVIAYIQSIKMANGEDPRMLRVAGILHPPKLSARVTQLTTAKMIAQAAVTGGGGADVEYVLKGFNLGVPMCADELSSAFTNGSDTTYYIITEQLATDQLGGLVYVEREPFSIVFNGEMTSAELSRRNELQWITRGRNVVGYGHPYLIHRVQAA